jgi:NAD(P)-dependent dehydrogenase (short-subunit alcohol dehydrogenase family)
MNEVTLVTGASSGIGEATARALLHAGHTVYAGARRVERMQGLAGHGAKLLALDVTDDASMQAAIAAIERNEGRLDALVNNAGYGSYGSLEEVPLEEGRRQFEVNVFGLARLTQLVLPLMRRQRRGRIVNVTSIGGKIHEPFGSWYHATKFAVEGLSDCLRMELARHGIDVIVIEPGAIRTEWAGISREILLRYSGDGPYRARCAAARAAGRLRGPP